MGSSIKGADTTAKSVYRNLLKAVRKHIGEEEPKSHFTDFIKQEFRKNINSENPQKLQLARDYTLHINSVHHHKTIPLPITVPKLKLDLLATRGPSFSLEKVKNLKHLTIICYIHAKLYYTDLLFSYNIAVDRSAEMKRVLGKSAASVGLRLPDVYQS